VSVHASEHRYRIVRQLTADANRDEWMQAFLGAPETFMADYWAGFIKELDAQMANWFPSPWKPGPNADLVAEEEKWYGALIMGDLILPKPRKGWRGFLHS
jgi:hypothetical protein